MRASGGIASLAALVLALGGSAARAEGPAAAVEGRVVPGIPELPLVDVAPVVVWLEPARGAALAPAARPRPVVRQRDARFQPRFLAIAVGQSVDMPNDDAIYHNVFSYSKPNEFDLGLYPAGESRTVTFRHAGVVKTYCAIHETMNGTIFVAPSPWFAVASPTGRFVLRDVPPGRHRLAVWAERLPRTVRSIEVSAGEQLRLEISLGAPAGVGGVADAAE